MIALGATVALLALLFGASAAFAAGPPARSSQGATDKGRAVHVAGKRGFGALFRRQQRVGESEEEQEEILSGANPDKSEPAPPRPPLGPRTNVVGDSPFDPQLDSRRRSDKPFGVPAPRSVAAADDFELFRNQPVAQGSGVTATVGEPTVANDRNAILYTGNWHAAVSGDDGMTWSYLNPATQFSSLRGGFCCDQIAYAVDRGDSSLVFWLLQYRDDGVNGGALRLVVYEGRNELLDQANYCQHTITPATINESGVKWFDFNGLSSTDDHLFLSTKVVDSATGNHVTGAVVRWDLSDFEDGNCSLSTGRVYKNATGSLQNTALAQGAGSTMYWGKRTANGQIDIWDLPDGTNTATQHTKTVSTWAASGRGQSHCPVPDGTDPCARANDKLNVAFIHDGKLGFAWNVADGNGFPFPHIRMARFDLPSLGLVDEPDVWNPSYAWAYAAAGVSAEGHLGLSLYRIGGGSFPRARVALVDDVDTNIDSLNVHGVITSDAGTVDPTGQLAGRWGDYSVVRPYGNCANTFAGAVHSQQGGTGDSSSEHRFVWFGREGDGCADLVVTDVGLAPLDLDRGDALLVGETTRNIGSRSAGSSTTRAYLSRDGTQSGDDLLLSATGAHGGLDRGENQGVPINATIPAGALGSYYVVVCADDTDAVDELTDTNNCLAEGTVTVSLSATFAGLPRTLTIPRFGAFARGTRFTASLDVRQAPGAPAASRAAAQAAAVPAGSRAAALAAAARSPRGWISLWLSRTPSRTRASRLVAARRIGTLASGRAPRTLHRRLRPLIPRSLPPGDYRVLACVDRRRRGTHRSRCIVAPHPLHVVAHAPRRAKASPKGD
jgi:hypothetical protein